MIGCSWFMIHESGPCLISARMGSRSRSRSRSHVTTKRAMGCCLSTPAFYHPDLLVIFSCFPTGTCFSQKWYRCNSRGLGVDPNVCDCGLSCGCPDDPGWARNSPLRIELVDLLSDALKAMGGWPKYDTCLGRAFHGQVAPRLVEAINKVCKKFNDAYQTASVEEAEEEPARARARRASGTSGRAMESSLRTSSRERRC